MNDLSAAKTALRADMTKRLREMTAEDRESASEELCERILEMTPWAEARTALLFVPLPSEPIITPLKLDCDARKVASVNIPQSARNETNLTLPESIDLILVPGLAFSSDRRRLGRGGGFFDRLLAGPASKAFKLGVCFSFQVLDTVPTNANDVIMDAVVTDSRVLG